MKKIATITFHSSYNYGSNLQAYALQKFTQNLFSYDVIYDIINLRNDKQKNMYKTIFDTKKAIKKVKNLLLLKYKKDICRKQINFENFITAKLNLTKEYISLDDLKQANLKYDFYISGSDQLWNLRAKDFDWSYYLEFVKKGKKISYSASFGPLAQTWNEEQKNRVKNNLLKYDCISVREKGSFDNVKLLTGKEPEINVDPTMLLKKEEWFEIIENTPLIKKDYILFYDLKDRKEDTKLVKNISKKIGLPVIITKYMGMSVHFTSGFEKKYDCGPLEFLNLIKNAKLVLSSSFHGTVFSILFNTPFYAINGANDFRIKTLLEKMNLQDRTIQLIDYEEKCKNAFLINFEESEKILNIERKRSEEYLKKALDIE